MHVQTVTLGTSANLTGGTPFFVKSLQPSVSLYAQTLVLYYGGAGTVYIGDSAVSATNGIPLTSVSAPLVIPLALTDNNDLYTWFAFGTAGQKLTVMWLE